jgi:hypothetical protein
MYLPCTAALLPQVDPCQDPTVAIEGCPQPSSEQAPPSPPSEEDNIVDDSEQSEEG